MQHAASFTLSCHRLSWNDPPAPWRDTPPPTRPRPPPAHPLLPTAHHPAAHHRPSPPRRRPTARREAFDARAGGLSAECREIRAKLRQLTLDNQRVWDREHAREAQGQGVDTPWVVKVGRGAAGGLGSAHGPPGPGRHLAGLCVR
jgi:hypothetical protein